MASMFDISALSDSSLSTPEEQNTENWIYVDCNKAETGDGSKENPFKTLKEALQVEQEELTVYLHPGDYDFNEVNIKLAHKNLSIIGEDEESVFIQNLVLSIISPEAIVWVKGCSIDGLALFGSVEDTIFNVENCKIGATMGSGKMLKCNNIRKKDLSEPGNIIVCGYGSSFDTVHIDNGQDVAIGYIFDEKATTTLKVYDSNNLYVMFDESGHETSVIEDFRFEKCQINLLYLTNVANNSNIYKTKLINTTIAKKDVDGSGEVDFTEEDYAKFNQ